LLKTRRPLGLTALESQVSARGCSKWGMCIASYLATCESLASPFMHRRNSCYCKTQQSWNTHAERGSWTSQALHWSLSSRLVHPPYGFVKILSCLVLQR